MRVAFLTIVGLRSEIQFLKDEIEPVEQAPTEPVTFGEPPVRESVPKNPAPPEPKGEPGAGKLASDWRFYIEYSL